MNNHIEKVEVFSDKKAEIVTYKIKFYFSGFNWPYVLFVNTADDLAALKSQLMDFASVLHELFRE